MSPESLVRLGLMARTDPRATAIRVVRPAGDAPRWSAAASRRPGEALLLPDGAGGLAAALFTINDGDRAMSLRALPAQLPSGVYRLDGPADGAFTASAAALAWALGAYRFDRHRSESAAPPPVLSTGLGKAVGEVAAIAEACVLARDLVNSPANHMGPAEIEAAARRVATAWGGAISVVAGDALLEAGYPLVHAVGRAAAPARAPRMIEITWGEPTDPLVVLVGKGVAFDSGGLDLKPAAGMRLMKKDMGGAAHALALADLIARGGLRVRLLLLIAAVENAVGGDAFRPGDVIASRAGPTVEIGNTDAEGRLVLADALARAGELEPDLTIDLATLTGAARVALGPQVVPFYTADDALAAELMQASAEVDDPLWRMPLWASYASALESDIADLKNDPDPWAQAGSVAAALFLQRFAPKTGAWVHFDIFAWNPKARPGYPVGAEAQAIRALWSVLQARFG